MRLLPAAVICIGIGVAASFANALEIEPFTAQALDEAKRTDAPVALQFHSSWCTTCKMQDRAFEQLRSDPDLQMKLLVVNFDEDRSTTRAFRVPVSGAVIVLRGAVERARLMGVVDREQLREALRKAF